MKSTASVVAGSLKEHAKRQQEKVVVQTDLKRWADGVLADVDRMRGIEEGADLVGPSVLHHRH
jgi:hypothetical protein